MFTKSYSFHPKHIPINIFMKTGNSEHYCVDLMCFIKQFNETDKNIELFAVEN